MVSSCHWGCRAVPARALQGRGGDGEGEGRLGSEGYSPGTQGTGRQTRELGSGAEAPGAGRAAMAEPAPVWSGNKLIPLEGHIFHKYDWEGTRAAAKAMVGV